MALKQASRLLNLGTPLGADVLLLTSFTGAEGVSQLFRFSLEMISDNAGIAAKDILGKNVTFSIRLADDSPRFFNGFVSRFAAGDEDQNGRRGYRAEVVPWFRRGFYASASGLELFLQQGSRQLAGPLVEPFHAILIARDDAQWAAYSNPKLAPSAADLNLAAPAMAGALS